MTTITTPILYTKFRSRVYEKTTTNNDSPTAPISTTVGQKSPTLPSVSCNPKTTDQPISTEISTEIHSFSSIARTSTTRAALPSVNLTTSLSPVITSTTTLSTAASSVSNTNAFSTRSFGTSESMIYSTLDEIESPPEPTTRPAVTIVNSSASSPTAITSTTTPLVTNTTSFAEISSYGTSQSPTYISSIKTESALEQTTSIAINPCFEFSCNFGEFCIETPEPKCLSDVGFENVSDKVENIDKAN